MEENKQEIKINPAEIDDDVLKLFEQDKVRQILNDPKLFNRAMLSAFAELLSEFKKLNQQQETLLNIITTLSNDKLQDFFCEVSKNYSKDTSKTDKIKK